MTKQKLYHAHNDTRKLIPYNINPSDINRPPVNTLKSWRILNEWGIKERVTVVEGSNGQSTSLRVFYPKGSINPNNDSAPKGGAGFHITGGLEDNIIAACLSYRIYFPEDFAFGKGGKLPGLYGGNPASGCREDAGITGFSTRYMWRENGAGTLYAYLPDKNEECGKLIGLGSWYFIAGKWSDIEQEIILNKPGDNNGSIRVWVNGHNVINKNDINMRINENIDIDGIMFSTFFGGRSLEWESPKDQSVDFADFRVYLPQ